MRKPSPLALVFCIPFLFVLAGVTSAAQPSFDTHVKSLAKQFQVVADEYSQLRTDHNQALQELEAAKEKVRKSHEFVESLTARYGALEQDFHELQDEHAKVRQDLKAARSEIDSLCRNLSTSLKPTDVAEKTECAVPHPYSKPQHLEAVVDIRRRNGSVLKGSILEDAETSQANEKKFIEAFRCQNATEAAHCDLQVAPAAGQVSAVGPVDSQGAAVNSLLEAASRIEREAHELDLSRRFDEACELRRLASKLRKTARRELEKPATDTSPLPLSSAVER